MMKYVSRKAFTFIELIMVIVILGIVSSIASSIIAQVFESYIIQKAVHNASLKTELAVNQLANRLMYRIDMSMLARHPGSTGLTTADIYPVQEVPLDKLDYYSALEWIGYDNDGFSALATPAWSGFTDLNNSVSSYTTLISPGSNLNTNYFQKTMKHYTGTTDGSGGAIIFLGTNDYKEDATGTLYSYRAPCMYTNSGCIFPVNLTAPDVMTFHNGDRNSGDMIYSEMYQFTTSAFAVVPENPHTINGIDVWDLEFYYAYQPWNNENYLNTSTKHSTLIKNVSVFRFRKEANSIRLKICSVEQVGTDDQISICKEKAVIR